APTVKALRDRTNAPMMDCKAALAEANGDIDKAIDILRKKNAAIQAKKGERETAEGRVAIALDPAGKAGAIIEVRCESAPVAKSEPFVQLANDLARQVVEKGAKTVEELMAQPYVGDAKKTVNDRRGETTGRGRGNMKVVRLGRLGGGVLGGYTHHGGSVGVLVQVEGAQADPQLLRDGAMHVTARSRVAARREDVAADLLEK